MRSSKSPCIRACLCMLLMHGAELIWLTLRLALPNLLIWLEMARFGVSLAAPPLSQLRLRRTELLSHGTHAVLFSVTGTTPPLTPNNHVSRANDDYSL